MFHFDVDFNLCSVSLSDRIFAEDSNTVDVYEALTKDIVSAAVGGFNGTLINNNFASTKNKLTNQFEFEISASLSCSTAIFASLIFLLE